MSKPRKGWSIDPRGSMVEQAVLAIPEDCSHDLALAVESLENQPNVRIEKSLGVWSCTLWLRDTEATTATGKTIGEAVYLVLQEQARQYAARTVSRSRLVPYEDASKQKYWSLEAFEQRFWLRVNKDGPVIADELGPCWLWTGGIDRAGYGVVHVGQKSMRATRVAWMLVHREAVGASLVMAHKCDNPPCVNPAHLFPATVRENALDAVNKGRWRKKSPRKPGWATLAKAVGVATGTNKGVS